MILVLISVIIIVILTHFAWKKSHDLTCPAVMFGCFWIVSLLAVQSYSDIIYDIKLLTMLIFSIGALLFHVGYKLGFSSVKGSIETIVVNPLYFRPIVVVLSLIFAYVMYDFMKNGVGENLYDMLRNENEDNTIGGYMKKIVENTSIGVLLLYWKTEDDKARKKVKKYVFLLTIMGLLCALSKPSRNAMLHFFMPMIVVYLCTHNLSIKKQLSYLLVSVVLFLGYYAYVSANKFSYKYESSGNSEEVLSSELQLYLSGSILAFDQCIEDHSYSRMGRNTFRFFFALFDKNNAESLVNDFYSCRYVCTNVFSFYDFYLRDFGPLYALFMQFLIGFFHGKAYKSRHSALGLYFLAMMSYPLVMQFFQDQYFSLASSWIQTFIMSIILFKTKIFAYVRNE